MTPTPPAACDGVASARQRLSASGTGLPPRFTVTEYDHPRSHRASPRGSFSHPPNTPGTVGALSTAEHPPSSSWAPCEPRAGCPPPAVLPAWKSFTWHSRCCTDAAWTDPTPGFRQGDGLESGGGEWRRAQQQRPGHPGQHGRLCATRRGKRSDRAARRAKGAAFIWGCTSPCGKETRAARTAGVYLAKVEIFKNKKKIIKKKKNFEMFGPNTLPSAALTPAKPWQLPAGAMPTLQSPPSISPSPARAELGAAPAEGSSASRSRLLPTRPAARHPPKAPRPSPGR